MALGHAILAASAPPDIAVWKSLIAKDVHLRIAHRPLAVGREAVLGELACFFGRVEALGRNFCDVWPSSNGQALLMELDLVPVSGLAAVPVAMIVRLVALEPFARDLRLYGELGSLGLPTVSL